MRENRTYGSEGGEAKASPTLSSSAREFRRIAFAIEFSFRISEFMLACKPSKCQSAGARQRETGADRKNLERVNPLLRLL
jgi:hypothetical protein